VPLGARPRLRAASPVRDELGYQPAVSDRDESRENQTGITVELPTVDGGSAGRTEMTLRAMRRVVELQPVAWIMTTVRSSEAGEPEAKQRTSSSRVPTVADAESK
jgi:hypothetical protein